MVLAQMLILSKNVPRKQATIDYHSYHEDFENQNIVQLHWCSARMGGHGH